ncbi:hypothetical protein ACHQM5_027750 [Ranunculus cassubicifolius]
MDVLLGSIDVRELLSTQDFDESSPLSVPDLRLLIDRLQIRSLHIKQKVRDYIISHHEDFSQIFTQCSNISSKTEEIEIEIEKVLSLFSDHPIDIEIRETSDEIRRKRLELNEKKEFLGLVRVIVNLSERIRVTKDDLRSTRLIQAAESLKELKIALLIDDDDDENLEDDRVVREPLVFGLLRKEWRDCFDEIQEVFVRVMENAVKFESGKVKVSKRVSVEGIGEVELGTVLSAMEVIGVLDYGLAKVADLLVKFVVIPTISNGCRFDFVEERNNDIERMEEAVLSLVSSSDSEVKISSIYPRILQVIDFVYNFVCLKNNQCMRCFGRLTWPRISELIISHFLAKAVPDDASKLSEFQKIIELTSEFETLLEEMKFISGSDDKDRRLSEYAQNVEVHFASRKKIEILAKARNILLQCDFSYSPEYSKAGHKGRGDNEEISEQVVELLFMLDRCIISKAGAQIIKLVHQTMRDVCLSSARVSMEFYHAARDAVLLYEAIIPVKLEKQLNSINEVAIVIHNDFLYLSQELLGLAFQYRSDFPSALKEQAVFIDMAPRFRQMAVDILQRQIQLVKLNLKEAVDIADGYQNTHQMHQYESAKLSIDQIIFKIERVRIIWEPLLLPSTYKRSMCTVLDFVFSRLLEDILLLDDMAAEETLQLQRLIQMLLENVSTLLESLNVIRQRQTLQEDAKHIPLDDHIPALPKLRKLADLLDMPLKSITNAWESGELGRCGYRPSEVEDLVKAIFTDSPLRKECLWRIRSPSL